MSETEHDDKDMGQPFDEWIDNGLLWLVNTTVFHPRGYALQLHVDADEDGQHVTGWSLLGDGSEPWQFGCDDKTQASIQGRFNVVSEMLKHDEMGSDERD